LSGDDVRQFFEDLGLVILWSAVAVAVAMLVFEVLNRRYNLMHEIFEENSVAAGVFGGAFVFGIFYAIAQIVVS
jgi:uncharacterized membrane protein YjfL (UPF0719 family)